MQRLERGEVPLDDAIALWERGEQLYRFCLSKLDAAEGRIDELAQRVEATRPDEASEMTPRSASA